MKLLQTRASSVGLIAGAAFLLCIAVPALADFDKHGQPQSLPPAISSGSCVETAMKYSVSTDLQTTGSKSYTDVGGTNISFDQGTSGCAEISFSAEGATVPGEILITRVLLDNATACLPDANFFASDSPSSALADHAMNYICTGVAPGSHTVKVQFRSRFGHKVALDYRTTIVRYTK